MAEGERRLADVGKMAADTRNKRKAKSQKVFIRLSERVNGDTGVKTVIQGRLRDQSLPFDIADKSEAHDGTGDTLQIVLQFPSRSLASKAVSRLHSSNRHTESKIVCSYPEEQGDVGTGYEREEQMKKHLTEIIEAARSALQSHDGKLREANSHLQEVVGKLDRSTELPSDEVGSLSSERDAREDKVSELTAQRKEFVEYVSNMKTNLQSLRKKYTSKFDHEVFELRKYFGVECQRLKLALPMYARKTDIQGTVRSNQVSVILGETGSGKSTQMVQYLHQSGLAAHGIIACTQPRKIAAVSLATHVASEMASSVGQVVGYQVGMQTRKTGTTKILFMTDHVLLNECLKDNTLSAFSCVIIDEAHERSIYTDLLLGMIKACLPKRPDMRVIITSATINPDVFVSYFGGPAVCPVLQVSGRTFPVSVHFEGDNESEPFPENYEKKALSKAVELHKNCPVDDGDILVFLTSALEIERCCSMFHQRMAPESNFQCLPLHGKLKPDEQNLVFVPCPKGKRKIVFATNSAETSVTIPGIKFVIDTGLAKDMRYDPKKNMNSLSTFPVSKSSAEQRKGRAGRVAPGVCFRLFSAADFKDMQTNTKPEILRVHLGQAMLKLLQLGVSPLMFDFPEAPDRDSLVDAMTSLEAIGAVANGVITDLGMWIAKLPCEPRLGVLVHRGMTKGVPIETLVIAACCNASGIFFRSGSETEKKEADVRKIKFCHPGGDLLTMLNVFRVWHTVAEKEKGKWCNENSVNGKAMKGIRETINEVLTTLRKDMKEEITFRFKPQEEADTVVQALIIQNMANNISHFLGHEQAGYITKKQLQHVQIHPSSSLKTLGQTPEWIVYSQVLQTSRLFVTNVTPIDTDVLKKVESESQILTDTEDLKDHRVSLVEKITLGTNAFRQFVGPMHKNRRSLEEQISAECDNTVVIIEGNRELSEIKLFSNPNNMDMALRRLNQALTPIKDPLLRATVEEPLGTPESGVRAILGTGGAVMQILMPDEFRAVYINIRQRQQNDVISDVDVRNKLSEFGAIEYLSAFKGNQEKKSWGKCLFKNAKDAKQALDVLNAETEGEIALVSTTSSSPKRSSEQFTLILTWIRRSLKGFGYVTCNQPGDLELALAHRSLLVGDTTVSVSRNKRGGDIYLKGLPFDANEDAVKAALAAAIGVENGDRFLVKLPRETVPLSTDERDVIKSTICSRIGQYVPAEKFSINVLEIKNPQATRSTAFVMFQSVEEFETAESHLKSGPLCINGHPVKVSHELSSSVFVTRRVYEATREDLESYIKQTEAAVKKVSIKVREVKSGDFSVTVKASSPGDLAAAKLGVQKIFDGDVLDSAVNENLKKLFTHEARHSLGTIEKDTKAAVFVDSRKMTVTIRRSAESRKAALNSINKYLETLLNASEKLVSLKGRDIPAGLMKALVLKYGTDLRTLKTESGVYSVNLNHKSHSICFNGKVEAIERAISLVEQAKTELQQNGAGQTPPRDVSVPECPICFCEIDQPDLIRLEFCGHPYCQTCLQFQMQSAAQDRQYPMTCAAEDCDQPFVWKDIKRQIDKGVITQTALAQASVSCFVGENQESFHYCVTPDCEVVYRSTADGRPFQCPVCGSRMCTTCHIQFHDGLTCAQFKHIQTGGGDIELWIKEDPKTRKRCPNCQIGVEKISGCNRVMCAACKVHMCWVCLEHFASSDGCYDHLSAKHGTFF